MTARSRIPIIHYDSEYAAKQHPRHTSWVEAHVSNLYPKGDLPWQVYQNVRNAVYRMCRRHGPSGPMGECPIIEDSTITDPSLLENWPLGDDPCIYYLIDDQYGNERYLRLEILDCNALSTLWLADLMDTLRQFPGWGVIIANIRNGSLTIFFDLIAVKGPVFERCNNVESVLRSACRSLAGDLQSEPKNRFVSFVKFLATQRAWQVSMVIAGVVVVLLISWLFRH